VRLFRADRLPYPQNFGLEIGDIGLQLLDPQQVKRRGKQKFFCRPGEIFVGICHNITLTKGSVGFHTPTKSDLRTASAHFLPFQAYRPVTLKGIRNMSLPLMPKATAVWLIDKTGLTFEQIADFCGMHPLEVQAIADGEVAQGINGYDPVANKQVTAEDIARCEANPALRLKLLAAAEQQQKKPKGGRYTPVAKRNDRPDAIAFLLRNFPHLSDAQIVKLLGTTKDTIQKIRDRSHWNSSNIKPRDPVILGLCKQSDLNDAVAAANDRLAREGLTPPAPLPSEAA
jgi:hypothetical protein